MPWDAGFGGARTSPPLFGPPPTMRMTPGEGSIVGERLPLRIYQYITQFASAEPPIFPIQPHKQVPFESRSGHPLTEGPLPRTHPHPGDLGAAFALSYEVSPSTDLSRRSSSVSSHRPFQTPGALRSPSDRLSWEYPGLAPSIDRSVTQSPLRFLAPTLIVAGWLPRVLSWRVGRC